MTRVGITWTTCNAPPEIFGSYEDIREEYQKLIEARGSIPCEGGGTPTLLCGGGLIPCPWFGGSETEIE